MRKKIYILFIFVFIMILAPKNVLALIGNADNTKVRSCPAADDSICPALDLDEYYYVVVNGEIELIELVPSQSFDTDACNSKEWYKINYNNQDGYICSSFVTIIEDDDQNNNESNENATNDNESNNNQNSSEEQNNEENNNTNEEQNNNQNNENNEPTPTTPVVNTIPAKYDVVAYASYPDEGRVPVVVLKPGIQDSFTCNKTIIVIDNKLKCVDNYKLTNYAEVVVLDTNTIPYDFEEELAKFPASYQTLLRTIHNDHPNWRFYAYNTNLDWNQVVNKEKNSSLIQSTVRDESFFDTEELANYNWKTNKFVPHESGVWVTPSKQATAYYLDPRTYLVKNMNLLDGVKDYRDIFVFEDARAYTYQTSKVIDQMLYYGGITGGFNTSYGYKTYRESFLDGSTFSKISPLILISRSRNETGNFTSGSVSGNFVNEDTHVSYKGLYNFFNVGAYGYYPITNGLIYAREAGWTDPYKSISEGSIFIGTKYIYNGQETQYFQKFNVSPYTLTSKFGHQYQTNIEAPMTEANFVFWGYYDSGNINQPIVFHIPVYNNMPEEPTMKPKYGNPNNWLKNIKINGENLANFNGDNYYSYNNNWDDIEDAIYEHNIYSYSIAWNVDSIKIEVEKANNKASVTGIGDINIDKTQVINIVVTAQNGTTKTYAIKINKQDMPLLDEVGEPLYPEITDILDTVGVKYNGNYLSGLDLGTSYQVLINAINDLNNNVSVSIEKNKNNPTEYFATGDKVRIKIGDTETELSYVLYGDINGDGKIDLLDLVSVRNIILKISNIKGEYLAAADIVKDGKIDLLDLISVRNDILGKKITQR